MSTDARTQARRRGINLDFTGTGRLGCTVAGPFGVRADAEPTKFPGFVYTDMELVEENRQLVLNVRLSPRRNSRAVCAGCGVKRPGYDRLGPRRFEFVPFWGILVYFVYAMRCVECPTCGIKVERVPWAEGKRTVTTAYAWFLARWAKELSWAQVAEAFHTSWYTVYSAVEMAFS